MARSNDAVAAMLQEFADLLAISGGDAFKVRAYEKAARAVEGYPLEVDGLDAKGLDAIPAVGSHLARKILEFGDTGSVAELDELRAKVPSGLRTLLRVPGLGPRHALQVYTELGITSLSELTNALREHRLRELRGWDEKSEQNLVTAIQQAHGGAVRFRLDVALELAGRVLARFEAVPGVWRATYAGSLRRMRHTVGDIDLLVASDEPAPVMDALVAMPLVARVLAKGPTKTSVVTDSGIQVDVRVISPSSWGAALMYFTGSKSHNIRVRALAVRAGLKLSEYGLFSAESGELIVVGTEEEVFARLGLPWIPPVLREDNGEVEAALEGWLPVLVQLGDLRGDLHTHTDLSDGVATLEEMVAAARKRGYEYFAITDHVPLASMRALAQRQRIRELEPGAGLTLLHGTEVYIQPDGSLGWEDEFLAGFDIVVASVHSYFEQPRTEMTARLLRAIEHPRVHVIGHPTNRGIGRRPPVDVDLEAVFRAAARTGTALEVNGFPDRLDLDGEVIRWARSFGVRFAIATGAHAVSQLDNVRFGVATAQRGWAAPGEVVNTWPLDRLRRFLGTR